MPHKVHVTGLSRGFSLVLEDAVDTEDIVSEDTVLRLCWTVWSMFVQLQISMKFYVELASELTWDRGMFDGIVV